MAYKPRLAAANLGKKRPNNSRKLKNKLKNSNKPGTINNTIGKLLGLVVKSQITSSRYKQKLIINQRNRLIRLVAVREVIIKHYQFRKKNTIKVVWLVVFLPKIGARTVNPLV
jgi:hypothetical protein